MARKQKKRRSYATKRKKFEASVAMNATLVIVFIVTVGLLLAHFLHLGENYIENQRTLKKLEENQKQWEDLVRKTADTLGVTIDVEEDRSSNDIDQHSDGTAHTRITVSEDWLLENLYKVKRYAKLEDNLYSVELVKIEEAPVCSFSEIQAIFNSAKYTPYNSATLKEGVNCQGMVIYLADWCKKTRHTFKVEYLSRHTDILIEDDGCWYRFDFDTTRSITKLDN